MDPLTLVVLAVAAGVVFDITNGWNDSSNAIATVVSTRVLSPVQALSMSAILNFIGALVSIKVAKTMGADVVRLGTSLGSVTIVLAAMLAAAAWVTWCTRLGLPISCSHALVGGLLGAAVFVLGWDVVQWWDPVKKRGVIAILIALLASPLLGFLLGYILAIGATWLAHGMEATPRQGRKFFGFVQLCSSSFMAFEHGKNDAQKVMGVLALALFAAGYLKKDGVPITDIRELYIPFWVQMICALAMMFGTAVGGWRVIRTLGHKLAKITTLEGSCAETGAGVVLEVAASMGVPVSTTHTITGAIVGVGATKGAGAVKWGLGAKILWAWVFTLPVCFLLGGSLSWFATKTSPVAMVGVVAAVTVVTYVAPYFTRPKPVPASAP